MTSRRMFVWCLAGILSVVGVGAVTPAAFAQSARAVGPTPPRLAFVEGEASFWRPGAEDWTPAQVNTALAAGDALYVGSGGNLEIEIGSRAYLRAGSQTELSIASLETGFLQLEVTSGHVAVDLKRLPEGQAIEVDTPHGAFTIERPGYYGVDVGDRTTFTVRQGGAATAIPAGGETTDVRNDQQAVLEGTDTATISVRSAPPPDDWDRWNLDRTGRLTERPRSAEYVPQPVAGIDDLDRYGEWRDAPRYGHVWVPRDVQPDWAPYSTGRWVWDPYYEWTWVDDQPWGWAPYHYGRWCHVDDYWAWAPGPVVARPVYAPALVAFLGSGGVSVSVQVGAPVVSWVALGWGEPVVPWWGPPGFVGRPHWGGWGGPRVVNNVVVNNTTIVNVRNINHYQNVDVRHAVLGVPRERFGRGRIDNIRVPEDQARRFQPMRGKIGVRPVAESLVPRDGRGARPPENIQKRGVVATRRPQDPAPRLRAAGLEPRGPTRQIEPRVIEPRRGHGVDEKGRERGLGRGMTPPPAPGAEGVRERGPGGRVERGSGTERGGPQDRERGGVAPVPPAEGERTRGTERQRGRERGNGVERGRGDAVPPPPPGAEPARANDREKPSDRGSRGRERAPDTAPPPPSTERGGGRDRGADTQRGRDQRPGGDAGGVERQHGRGAAPNAGEPAPRTERETRPPRPERGSSDRERPAAAPAEQRMERGRQPRAEPPPAAPRVERAAPPPTEQRMDRGGPQREERHMERSAPPREERRMERSAPPRVERGGPPPAQQQPAMRRESPPDAPRMDRGAHQRERAAERAAPPPPQPQAAPQPPHAERRAPAGGKDGGGDPNAGKPHGHRDRD